MKKLIVDCLSGQLRAVILNDGKAEEIIIDDKNKAVAAGSIYVGRVENVQKDGFAFVNIGDSKNAFLQTDNTLKLKRGDSVVVQVEKEAYGTKGANLTTTLSFSGKYIVLTTENKNVGVSAKICKDQRRKELQALVESVLPQGYSGVVRTNSENADNTLIVQEIKTLLSIAENIKEKGKFAKPPYEIYKVDGEIEKIIRDYIPAEAEVIVNENELYSKLRSEFPNVNIKFYEKSVPIFSYYMIESQLEKAMQKRVWLKSGGFLVIEPTEAMTVIDVNTGKFTGKDRETTIFKTNMEACEEIALQLRLRNLSGMIIVDFIDMNNKENLEILQQTFKNALKRDRIKTVVVGMTQLGLMQLTRQKIHKPLHNILKCECPYCNGTAMVDSSEYLISKIKNHVQTVLTQTIYKDIVVETNYKNIKALEKDGFKKIFLERYNGRVEFKQIDTLQPDYYQINYKK